MLILHPKSLLRAFQYKTKVTPVPTPNTLEPQRTQSLLSTGSLRSWTCVFLSAFPISFLPSALIFVVHAAFFVFISVTVLNSKLAVG